MERRTQWDKLDLRTKAQVDEEETLLLEHKRIEAAHQAHHKDREYVEKLTQTALSSPVSVLSPSTRPLVCPLNFYLHCLSILTLSPNKKETEESCYPKKR